MDGVLEDCPRPRGEKSLALALNTRGPGLKLHWPRLSSVTQQTMSTTTQAAFSFGSHASYRYLSKWGEFTTKKSLYTMIRIIKPDPNHNSNPNPNLLTRNAVLGLEHPWPNWPSCRTHPCLLDPTTESWENVFHAILAAPQCHTKVDNLL